MAVDAFLAPIAVWHDLGFFSGYLVSDLGRVDGTPNADLRHHHCVGRKSCSVIDEPLGRCMLFSTTLLQELGAGIGTYQNLHASRRRDLIDLSVDHAGSSHAATRWTYRLLPLRWRTIDHRNTSTPTCSSASGPINHDPYPSPPPARMSGRIAGMDEGGLVHDSLGGASAWWCDPQEVIRFAHVLVDADQLGGCQHQVITFFETPWEWDTEYRMWCEAARPPTNDGSSAVAFAALCTRFGSGIDEEHPSEYSSPRRWRSWSTQI